MRKLRVCEHWSKWKSEFPIEFDIKLVHKASSECQIIFSLCFCHVKNDLLPKGKQTFSPFLGKLLINEAIYQLNKYNKTWPNTNLAKTQTLFTVEFYELLEIFWEMYCFNLREVFAFTCIHTLRLQNCGFLYKTGVFSGFKFSASHFINFVFWVFFCFLCEFVDCERKSLGFEGRT